MDIDDDDSDYYIPSHKEDVETGIFRRKTSNLNDDDERIKKDLKHDKNYIFLLYISIIVILFIFVIQNIYYEDSNTNFQKLHYLKYKLSNNKSHDLGLHLHLNNNKNTELNEHFYYLNKIE